MFNDEFKMICKFTNKELSFNDQNKKLEQWQDKENRRNRYSKS